MKIYGAAALVAARAGADIVPLRIQGTLTTRWAATSSRWPRRLLPRYPGRAAVYRFPRVLAPGGERRRQLADDPAAHTPAIDADAAPRRTLF